MVTITISHRICSINDIIYNNTLTPAMSSYFALHGVTFYAASRILSSILTFQEMFRSVIMTRVSHSRPLGRSMLITIPRCLRRGSLLSVEKVGLCAIPHSWRHIGLYLQQSPCLSLYSYNISLNHIFQRIFHTLKRILRISPSSTS